MKRIGLFVVMLLVLSISSVAIAFNDTQSHWAKDTIDWAVQQNIAKGYPDGTFRPNTHVVEAEFLAMLIRTYEGEKEVNSTHWADGYYQFSDNKNYPTNGSQDVNKRSWVMTRKQVAEIVAGTQGVNYTGNDAIHYLLLNGLAKGKNPSELTIASFEGEATLTRAEALQFIKNVQENGTSSLQTRPIVSSPELPKIGVNDRIIPLKPVDEVGKPTNPQQPQVPKPEQPEQPNRIDPSDNSPETVEQRLREALEMNKPELTLTQEDIYTWGREMFELGKKAEIVNGKLRLYYPQVPEDKKDKWWISVTVDTKGKRESAIYGAYGRTYDSPANERQSRTIPVYDDFDIGGSEYSFFISLREQGELGAKPFASVGYDSVSKRISVNSRSVLFDHEK